jgi:hypothetical protein
MGEKRIQPPDHKNFRKSVPNEVILTIVMRASIVQLATATTGTAAKNLTQRGRVILETSWIRGFMLVLKFKIKAELC